MSILVAESGTQYIFTYGVWILCHLDRILAGAALHNVHNSCCRNGIISSHIDWTI